jgi:hypothetical protein
LFWASDYEIDVWLSGLPDDSAFLKPFVGDAEARQRESDEARREIMGNINAPSF